MIYDCFTFNNELDLLELRLHELTSVVGKFVLVESDKTFSGLDKPLYFSSNKARFSKFSDQIIHVIVDDMDKAVPAEQLTYFKPKPFQLPHLDVWSRELHQRNAILRGLGNCRASDIVLISDVDEIPKAKKLSALKVRQEIVGLEQNNYNYFINCRAENNWIGTKALSFKHLKNIDPEQVREENTPYIIPDAGWHFSFLGGYSAVQNKIGAFSHQEHNNQQNKDPQQLRFNLENGLDIFARPFKYSFTKIDSSYPKYLVSHPDQFKKFIHQELGVSTNTLALREEVFRARTQLYWKQLELEAVQKNVDHYRSLYRQTVKYNPIPYIIAKIKEKITTKK